MSCVYPIFRNEKIIEICQVTYVQLAREIQRLQIIQIAKSCGTVRADRAGGGNAGGGSLVKWRPARVTHKASGLPEKPFY
jgi:hypothetical protein